MQPSSGQITLSGIPAFRTTDPDAASRHLSPYLCRHRVRTRDDRHLFFKHRCSDVGDIGLHLLRYGVDLTISGSPEEDYYILLLLLEGWGELTQGKLYSTAGPDNVCVINPDKDMSLFLTSDQSNLSLRVPRRMIEDFISRETGMVHSIHFLPPPRQNYVISCLFCSELCRNSTSLASGLISRQIEQTLVGAHVAELP